MLPQRKTKMQPVFYEKPPLSLGRYLARQRPLMTGHRYSFMNGKPTGKTEI